jgi:hypothetical protein
LFLFPAIWIGLLLLPDKRFKEKKFAAKYGAMFDQMRPGRKIYLLYYIIFSLRRLIFCALAFYCTTVVFFQVQMLMFLNLFILLYIGGVQPFDTKFKNQIEMFNEFCICILTIQMTLFTDFVGRKDAQFDAGWQMVGVMVVNMFCNLSIVLVIGAKGTRLLVVKYARLAWWQMSRLWVKIKDGCAVFGACLKGQKQKLDVLCQKMSAYTKKVDDYT